MKESIDQHREKMTTKKYYWINKKIIKTNSVQYLNIFPIISNRFSLFASLI